MKLLTAVFFMFVAIVATAQTSRRGFSFQGYATNPEGVALGDEGITVRFTVYPKAGSGFIYEETQNLTTDTYGVFHAVVGNENPQLFQKMNFTAKGADYWMKVEVKKTTGGVYTTISDDAMLAVPYARHAANGVPVGTIIPFAGVKTKVPEGWLLCDGAELDGTDPQYEQLYNVLENTWGGTGTAFNLPDLRGQFLRGFDGGAGNDPDVADRTDKDGNVVGDAVGTYQTNATAFPNNDFVNTAVGSHTHNSPVASNQNGWPDGAADSGSGNGEQGYWRNGSAYAYITSGSGGEHNHTITGGDNETRPKNAAVLYIIKY